MLKSGKRDVIQTNKDQMTDVQTHLGDSKPLIFPNAIIDINMKLYKASQYNKFAYHIFCGYVHVFLYVLDTSYVSKDKLSTEIIA